MQSLFVVGLVVLAIAVGLIVVEHKRPGLIAEKAKALLAGKDKTQ